jgi:hypothetical protein
MAKKPQPKKSNPDSNGETVAGYFRKVFSENPRLLGESSNDKLLARWLADHPDQTEVPKSVRGSLSNIKSVLRSKKRKRVARRAQESQSGESGRKVKVATVPTGGTKLENLEHQIDECLTIAKVVDREGLDSVITLLRRARNEVVWKIGQ